MAPVLLGVPVKNVTIRPLPPQRLRGLLAARQLLQHIDHFVVPVTLFVGRRPNVAQRAPDPNVPVPDSPAGACSSPIPQAQQHCRPVLYGLPVAKNNRHQLLAAVHEACPGDQQRRPLPLPLQPRLQLYPFDP